MSLNRSTIHPDWQPIIAECLKALDPHYLAFLENDTSWLPGHQAIFNAFTLPLKKTRYILFGESPYPRAESANGYAFWDAAVNEIWCETGLSKPVNRATSLRNLIKLLLIAESRLSTEDTSQAAIAAIHKEDLVKTLYALFQNFLSEGFLLLNASLAFDHRPVSYHANSWHPFIVKLLSLLASERKDIQLILWGNLAKKIEKIPAANQFSLNKAEHPYNISFISNHNLLIFLEPFHLLRARN
jgi:uracil-DNA glycosylase